MKKALITGITGMDGSYLSELLLSKGYEVHGIVRRSSSFNTERIDHLVDDKSLVLWHGDLTDPCNLRRIIDKAAPDEIYNLAAQSHVGTSFDIPVYTAQVDAIGTLILLDCIKEVNPKIKMYQASTSELFGGLPGTNPQSENTPFEPRSPYAVAKLYAYWVVKNYREAYNMFATNGILFNHSGERRLPTFVSRKITYGISQILNKKQEYIELGNINSSRDFGYSKDYVQAQWLMLQQEKPDDYVIATGETHTIREFAEEAFRYINIDLQWCGSGENEEGFDPKTNKVWIKINPKYYRPAEVDILQGDYSKAKRELGWEPKVKFKELVNIMMRHDLSLIEI